MLVRRMFGYGKSTDGQLYIIPEEAEVVRWIFCQAAKGKAYADLARRLNVRQIPAPESDALRKRTQKLPVIGSRFK